MSRELTTEEQREQNAQEFINKWAYLRAGEKFDLDDNTNVMFVPGGWLVRTIYRDERGHITACTSCYIAFPQQVVAIPKSQAPTQTQKFKLHNIRGKQ